MFKFKIPNEVRRSIRWIKYADLNNKVILYYYKNGGEPEYLKDDFEILRKYFKKNKFKLRHVLKGYFVVDDGGNETFKSKSVHGKGVVNK